MKNENKLTIADRVVAATHKLAEYRSELSGSSALGASGQVAFLSELIQLLNPELAAINAAEHALAVERKRWNALKKELEHRYATEGIPARKAEVDSILAEVYALEAGISPKMPPTSLAEIETQGYCLCGSGKSVDACNPCPGLSPVKCDCDGGCFTSQGCYLQRTAPKEEKK